MKPGNAMQNAAYQPVWQYIHLQTTQFKDQQPRGQNNSHSYHSFKSYGIL